MPGSESGKSFTSFNSSQSGRSFVGKSFKYELKQRFYEKLDDFRSKVLLYKEAGFAVYRARCKYSGAVVVIKGYSHETLTPQMRQRVWGEVQLLQSAQCPFIVKCFDAFVDQGWWWLVLENCAGGDLYQVVQSHGGRLGDEGWLVSQVVLPVLQTLAYLHGEGVVHRDIKPEHILFNSEKVAKLGGFTLSWDTNRHGMPADIVGTLEYVAPEVFVVNAPGAGAMVAAAHPAAASRFGAAAAPVKTPTVPTSYDFKVDIWSLGVTVFDVLVGQPPFNDEDPNRMVENILTGQPTYPDWLSDEAVDFIFSALKKDPEERPSARRLLAHPWVRQYLDWQPPSADDDIDWSDPVPDVDTAYYQSYAGRDVDEASLGDEGHTDPAARVWYKPTTWFRRQQQDMDLDGFDEDDNLNSRGAHGRGVQSFSRGVLSHHQAVAVAPEDGAANRFADRDSGASRATEMADRSRFILADDGERNLDKPRVLGGLPRSASPSSATPVIPPLFFPSQLHDAPRAGSPAPVSLAAALIMESDDLIVLSPEPSYGPRSSSQLYLGAQGGSPSSSFRRTGDSLMASPGRRHITPEPPRSADPTASGSFREIPSPTRAPPPTSSSSQLQLQEDSASVAGGSEALIHSVSAKGGPASSPAPGRSASSRMLSLSPSSSLSEAVASPPAPARPPGDSPGLLTQAGLVTHGHV